MTSPLTTLTYFVVIIVVGILLSILAKKLKVSNLLLLLLAGIAMGAVSRKYNYIDAGTDTNSMVVLAILALVVIIFDGSSRFEVKALSDFSVSALKLTGTFLVLNIIFLGLLTTALFFQEWTLINLLYAFIFAIIISGTDPASVFAMLKSKTNKVIEFLEVEALINTPMMVILPFILLDVINQLESKVLLNWQSYLSAILTQILVGIGAGIFIGIIFFKAMKSIYSEEISPLAIITSALLAYILAENLGGNGVLSVAVLGFLFGNIYIANKAALQLFSTMVSNSLEILVFILLGFIIEININLQFLGKSFAIFIIMILARYIATKTALKKKEYTPKEIWFVTLNMPKGIAVAVIAFSLSVLGLSQIETINNLIVVIMIYSLLTSTIINKMANKFLNLESKL